jgi:glycosyltransferase involved in cell wall biosynthesis
MTVALVDSVPLTYGGGYERFLTGLAATLGERYQIRPDMISPKTLTLTRTALHIPRQLPRGQRNRCLSRLRSADVAYVKNEPHELGAVLLARRGRRTVVGTHSAILTPQYAGLSSKIYGSPFYGTMLRTAHFVHVLDQLTSRWLQDQHHVDPARILHIPNGVDINTFFPKTDPDVGSDRPLRVVFVGRLTVQKGIDLLLFAFTEALKAVGLHLTIVGAGPEQRLVDRATRLDPKIKTVGALPTPEVARILRAADVVVAPSRWEVQSLVPMEALASGAVLLLSDITANECYDNSPGIRKVPAGEAQPLADALVQLAQDRVETPAQWAMMIQTNRRQALDQWDASRLYADLAFALISATSPHHRPQRQQG